MRKCLSLAYGASLKPQEKVQFSLFMCMHLTMFRESPVLSFHVYALNHEWYHLQQNHMLPPSQHTPHGILCF